jgi:hypothetical protein
MQKGSGDTKSNFVNGFLEGNAVHNFGFFLLVYTKQYHFMNILFKKKPTLQQMLLHEISIIQGLSGKRKELKIV